MERNFETVMIEQCAPVLASLKPAGLFRYETRDCADLATRVHRWNDQLGEKGLKVRVLKGCAHTHRYLIYVYRESRLRQVLADEAEQEFLHREGYALPESIHVVYRYDYGYEYELTENAMYNGYTYDRTTGDIVVSAPYGSSTCLLYTSPSPRDRG